MMPEENTREQTNDFKKKDTESTVKTLYSVASPTVDLLMSKVFFFLQWRKTSRVKRMQGAAGVVLWQSDTRPGATLI